MKIQKSKKNTYSLLLGLLLLAVSYGIDISVDEESIISGFILGAGISLVVIGLFLDFDRRNLRNK